MFDIVSYWLVYTVLAVGVLSFPLYWLCDLIDVIIKDLTNGRFVNAFSNKFRNPWMSKFGLHEAFCDDRPTDFWNDNDCLPTVVLIVSVITFLISIGVFVDVFCKYSMLPYEVLAKITIVVTPYVSTPLFLIVGYVLVRGVIKKAFTKYEDLESKLKKLD